MNIAQKKLNLNILGLMAIPPNDGETKKYFKKISDLNSSLGLTSLSIGMSNDYIEALRFGSSHIRIGTSIFGKEVRLCLCKIFCNICQ